MHQRRVPIHLWSDSPNSVRHRLMQFRQQSMHLRCMMQAGRLRSQPCSFILKGQGHATTPQILHSAKVLRYFLMCPRALPRRRDSHAQRRISSVRVSRVVESMCRSRRVNVRASVPTASRERLPLFLTTESGSCAATLRCCQFSFKAVANRERGFSYPRIVRRSRAKITDWKVRAPAPRNFHKLTETAATSGMAGLAPNCRL